MTEPRPRNSMSEVSHRVGCVLVAIEEAIRGQPHSPGSALIVEESAQRHSALRLRDCAGVLEQQTVESQVNGIVFFLVVEFQGS